MSSRRAHSLLLLLVVAAAPAAAQDPEFWNDTRYVFARTDRVTAVAEGTVRVDRNRLYDRRGGVEGSAVLTSRFRILAGHLFRQLYHDGIGFDVEQRTTAGFAYRLPIPTYRVLTQTLYERHYSRPTEPDFNRYRQQFDAINVGARLSPWLHQDFTIRDRRVIRSRSRGGVRYRFGDYALKVAYQFESIRNGASWLPRHTLFTELTIDRPLFGGD